MGLFATAKPVLVVDIAAVLKDKGVRGNVAPRQQLQILRSLSGIVQRENIKVTAVLVGKPLDKAPHNKVFDHVRVRYAKTSEKLNKELLRALKQAGATGVMITSDVALENRIIRSGGETLRVSTFRKLLDDGNQPAENGGGNNNRSQRNNRRDRGPRQNRGGNRPPKQPRQTENESENRGGDDAISQMIDLVD